MMTNASDEEALRLVTAFYSITNAELRKAIIASVEAAVVNGFVPNEVMERLAALKRD